MPIYEFVCDACGERFEDLVAVGTEVANCKRCGAEGARRVLSAQASMPKLIKTSGEARRQERKNADLQKRSKKAFGETVRRADPRRGNGG